MNSRWIKIGVVVLIVGLVGLAALSVSAQGPGNGMRPGWNGYDNSLLSVAADALGIERTELVTQLQAGKTIAELAEAKGVELETIVDAFTQDRAKGMADRVAAGWMTQAQADAMLAIMKTHVTELLSQTFTPGTYGHGMGNGMMGGGMHGMGFGMENGMMGRGMHGWYGYGLNLQGTGVKS